MNNPAAAQKTAVLLLRSTSRNFPLDLVPELEKTGHSLHVAESLDEFIASPVRSRPFLAVIEIGSLTDLDRAVIVFDWTEQMQPLAPGRYLLLLSSKNIQLGDRVHRFGSAEIAVLPQPARNLLFKLELQGRLLASQGAGEKHRKQVRGFSTTAEVAGDGRRRILIARGQDERSGSWRNVESAPQGQVRWRWIRNPEREAPGENDDYSWLAESLNAPAFDKKLDAWVIEGDSANLLCLKGETKLYDANAAADHADARKTAESPKSFEAGAGTGPQEPEKEVREEPGKGASPKNTPSDRSEAEANPEGAPEENGEASDNQKDAEAAAAREEKERINPFAPGPAPTEESAPGQPTAAQNAAVSALARLKRQLDLKNAGDSPPPPGHGELLYNAPAGESGPLPQRRVQTGGPDAPAAPFREIPSRADEEKKGAERLPPAGHGAATRPAAPDPEDFSRSAGLDSLQQQNDAGASAGSAAGPAAVRGAGPSAPVHAIPSREQAPTPASARCQAVAPGRQGSGEGKAAGEGKATAEPATAAPTGSAPAELGLSPAPEGEMKAATALPATKEPAPPLPGDAFDSHLPPLTSGRGSPEPPPGSPGASSAPRPAPADFEEGSPEPPDSVPASTAPATRPGRAEPLENEQAFRPEAAAPGQARSVAGAPAMIDNLEAKRGEQNSAGVHESRRFLKDRLFLLMTLQELSDKESSWHPVGKFRIYLSAKHRYYGLPHPGDVLPLWIYDGELAPEFIDEQKSWKFYDRLPVAIYNLETLPHDVLEHLYRLAGKEPPKEHAPTISASGLERKIEPRGPLTAGETPDHYEPEAKKKNRGTFGKVLDFIKGLFGK